MAHRVSIQKKLLQVIMLICGTALSLTCLALFVYEYISYRDITRNEVMTLGQMVATNTTSSLAFDARQDAAEILQSLKAQKHIVAACLFDKSGKLFASYPANLSADQVPKRIGSDGYGFNNNYVEGFEPVTEGNNRLGTLYIRSDLKAVYTRFRLYGSIAIGFILLSFFFAYFLTRRLQRTISDPILALAEKARIISNEKDYTVRASKINNDEVGELTDAFNHMLTEIQAQNEDIKALNTNLEEKIVLRTIELQQANISLKQQNEMIQTIIDSSIDLIAVLDENLNYQTINKAAARVFERSQEEIVGYHLLDVFPNLTDKPIISYLQRALRGEVVHVPAYQSQVSSHYFENYFVPLMNKENKIDRVLIIGHDLTDVLQASERLRELNTELEKSNRDLEQFAYVASHDLQEPLRKIQIFSQLLEKNLATPELANNYLQKISSSASRMSDLIKAVLNYSKLSKGDKEFIPVNLNEIIAQTKTDLELPMGEKHAMILADGLPILKAIPLQMSQLFLNLISNSLKFSDKPPVINITVHKPTDNTIEIIYRDNGIGFDQQFAAQAFSIFQRLHTTEQYAGTGIGLALCKKIVENHNGTIRVESEPGNGTTFFICFPSSVVSETENADIVNTPLQVD